MPKTNDITVIMNPPYNEGKNKVIFHNFIESFVDNIRPEKLISIHPTRWLTGGSGLASFRERMLKDKQLKEIQNFYDSRDIFPEVQIKGGVQILVWERDHQGPCKFDEYNVSALGKYGFWIEPKYHSIVDKVLEKSNVFLSEKVENNFGKMLPTNFSGITDEAIGEYRYKCYASKDRANKVAGNFHGCSIGKEHITEKGLADSWKVFFARAAGAGADGFGNAFIGFPGEVCTDTYKIIKCNSRTEAFNVNAYLGTKFANFMLSLKKMTQDINSASVISLIPFLDFSEEWTDEKLKQHFNLTEEEWALIEERIGAFVEKRNKALEKRLSKEQE